MEYYSSEENEIEDEIEDIDYDKYISDFNEMVEEMYDSIIVPYLKDYKCSEILDKLDEFSVNDFFEFMQETPYFRFLIRNSNY